LYKKIGPWSIYGLAETALAHYFPEEYEWESEECDENGSCGGNFGCKGGTVREAELLNQMGLTWWQDVVQKYQREVGYDAPDGFNPDAVNGY